MSDKIYLGNGKKAKAFEWGTIYRGAIKLDDLKKHYDEHGFVGKKNGAKYLPVDIIVGEEPDKYGNTLSIQVNTWKPDGKEEKGKGGDLPFS